MRPSENAHFCQRTFRAGGVCYNQFSALPEKGMNTQLKICASDFGFLDHDSYVDCSSLFVKSVKDFEVLMKNGLVNLIGHVDLGTMDKVVLAASESRFLNQIEKKFFDESL